MRGPTVFAISAAAAVTIACAVVGIGVSDAFTPRTTGLAGTPSPTTTAAIPSAVTSTSDQPASSPSTIGSASPSASPVTSAPTATSAAPAAVPVTAPSPVTSKAATTAPPPAAPAPVTGQALPLGSSTGTSTGTSTQVITVVAASTGSTTAALQAWDKAPGGGWLKHGAAVTAHVGSAGLTSHPSESLSATPIGSFALSRAFGALANPGTALNYHKTTSADWWISQPGSLYNTMQTCSGSCPFTQGDPNEHLYYETPFYNYAVVIEYNTAAPITQGAGSAFFLHVTDGTATAGCVAIPQANLVSIMQWLSPSASPRILIGIG